MAYEDEQLGMEMDGAVAQHDEALIATLQRLPLFETFSHEQLAWLCGQATVLSLEAGTRLFVEGQQPDAFWVLLEGAWRFTRWINGRETTITESDAPGTWGGYIPWATNIEFITTRVLYTSRFLRIPPPVVEHMLLHGFPLAPHLLAGLSWGIRNFEAVARQQEKLAALGKLSAGLAHELNNPAAAAQRAAQRLGEAVGRMELAAARLCAAELDAAQHHVVEELRATALHPIAAEALDPLTRSDREEALGLWLDARGLDDAFELAATLLDAGLDQAALTTACATLPPSALSAVLHWLHANVESRALVRDVTQSTERIAQLVGAVKAYTYMDQAPLQEIDIHDGLEQTLIMLTYRLREVRVTRHFDRSAPRICAYGSELNEVWTNLLDNAIDALSGRGAISIRTTGDADGVIVAISDDGPGVPAELLGRIWEPFFTTKAVGEGTGLGLDTVYRVVQRHGGTVAVESRPGATTFSVALPRVPA